MLQRCDEKGYDADCWRNRRGQFVAKDKKKKKEKKGKKPGAGQSAAQTLKALSENRLVSEVVAAALVGAAAALKDSKKAHQLAASASDELEKLSRKSAERGSAMWQLALDIGRRALDEVVGDFKPAKAPKAPKAPTAPKAPKAPRAGAGGSASSKKRSKSKTTASSRKK
jgi:hypothetical protein